MTYLDPMIGKKKLMHPQKSKGFKRYFSHLLAQTWEYIQSHPVYAKSRHHEKCNQLSKSLVLGTVTSPQHFFLYQYEISNPTEERVGGYYIQYGFLMLPTINFSHKWNTFHIILSGKYQLVISKVFWTCNLYILFTNLLALTHSLVSVDLVYPFFFFFLIDPLPILLENWNGLG